MLKKINIQVGLFLMLLLVLSSGGCGNSKDDKGKASTPAARKAKMEKVLDDKGKASTPAARKAKMENVLKGSAGKRAESDVIELLKENYNAEGKRDPDSEAKKALKRIKAVFFDYAEEEIIYREAITRIKTTTVEHFFRNVNNVEDAGNKISQFIDMLVEAHGGLKQ